MNIDEILDVIDELLDRSWSLPLSGGRCVVDADKVRDLIDDIRLNIPSEIKQAKAIVSDRTDIISGAKKEAESIIRKAEDRARSLVAQEQVVKAAQAKASARGQSIWFLWIGSPVLMCVPDFMRLTGRRQSPAV